VPVAASGMTCPVAGPNSFIDSWGFPRSGGRTHEGTDIVAAFGTPVVAIVSGTITYAGYGSSAGNGCNSLATTATATGTCITKRTW
jgi:murein DD-endopeptidase MepM/ murein hydrolase activator NlpD